MTYLSCNRDISRLADKTANANYSARLFYDSMLCLILKWKCNLNIRRLVVTMF